MDTRERPRTTFAARNEVRRDYAVTGERWTGRARRSAGENIVSRVFENGVNSSNRFVARYLGLWFIRSALPARLGGFADS